MPVNRDTLIDMEGAIYYKLEAKLVTAVNEYARHSSDLCNLAGIGNAFQFAEAKWRCERDIRAIEEIKQALERIPRDNPQPALAPDAAGRNKGSKTGGLASGDSLTAGRVVGNP